MAKKQLMLLVSLMLVLSVFLAACTGKENAGEGEKETEKPEDTSKTEETKEEEPAEEDADGALIFPLDTSNSGAAIEDGEMTYGLQTDTPFEGTLNKVFYSGQPDFEIMSFFDENLLTTDGDFLITNDGAATYEISDDNKTVTIKIKDGVKWHDGEPVKASDLLYTYQLLGHPDYTGTRYTFMVSNVEGMPDYNAGKTDEISGIEVSEDEKTIAITFTEASPSLLSGLWNVPTPRHYVGDVTAGELTIEELAASEKIRTSPIGFGPYKVAKVVPGESVLFERYEDYWRGKPALKSVVLKVVSSASVLESLKKGDVDMVKIPVDQYNNAKVIENIELLAKVDTAYTYIGFKLGKWDAEKTENITDPIVSLSIACHIA